MAASLIQSITATETSNTFIITLRNPPAVGNTIVLIGGCQGANFNAPADNAGNTYTLALFESATNCQSAVYYAPVTASSASFVIEWSVQSTGVQTFVVVYEVSGLSSTQPDVSPTGFTSTASPTSVSPTSQTPTVNGDFALVMMKVAGPSGTASWTSPTGFTSTYSQKTMASPGVGGEVDYMIVSGTGTVSPSWTSITGITDVSSVFVLFRATGSVSSASPPIAAYLYKHRVI